MKRYLSFFAVCLAVGLFASPAWSQGMGRGLAACPQNYDVATEQTAEGTIVQVARVAMPPGRGGQMGIHVLLQTDDADALAVHLGPAWYLDQQGPAFQKGDAVTVFGSRVVIDDAPALIAKTVTRADSTLVLRDDQGFPMWRGWRRQ